MDNHAGSDSTASGSRGVVGRAPRSSPRTGAERGSGWPCLFQLAARQANVIASRQAIDRGVARSSLRERAVREGWERPFPGVYLLPGASLTPQARAVAAALATGTDAVISGRTALAIHGVTASWPLDVELLIPASRRRRPVDGIDVRRTTTLLPSDTVPYAGVALATVPRGFLDAARGTSRERLRALLIDARQRRLVTVEDIAARLDRAPRAVGRQRLAAACRDVAGSGADSPLVERVERWLEQLGYVLDVPPRVVETASRTLHPDITLAGLPVAIEVDGFAYHASRRELDLDQRKHNAYLLAGWTVLRIGWDRFAADRPGFLAELRAAIDRCGPQKSGTS